MNHTKIANSSFFIYQFNIAKFIPSLGLLLEWGTLKNSFFVRYVTNEVRFTPAALHWGDLIFDTFDTDSHRFVIYPYDKYQFSDFLFINTQLRFSHANQEAFSKSHFLYELAQRIFDQMNFIPFMTSFVHETLHHKFKDLFDSLSYQKIIRSETHRNLLQFLKKIHFCDSIK
jgi:hypothetical protein